MLSFFLFLPECHKDGSSLDVAFSYHLSVAPIDVMAPRLVSSRRRALILISWPNEASQLGCGSGGKHSSAITGTFCALVNKATGMESWQCERDDVSPTDMREGRNGPFVFCAQHLLYLRCPITFAKERLSWLSALKRSFPLSSPLCHFGNNDIA